ncbi:MAG: response regulator [Pseudomonadales bacterium]|nr:response regulator [Pseudomonadales bacterium]
MTHLLAIDDSPCQQLILANQLAGSGFTLLTADSLSAAKSQLRRYPVKLILIELLLLTDNGFQLATRLRHLGHYPLVLMSARKLAADQHWCRARGFRQLLQRPLSSDQLVQSLHQLLKEATDA